MLGHAEGIMGIRVRWFMFCHYLHFNPLNLANACSFRQPIAELEVYESIGQKKVYESTLKMLYVCK